MSQLNEILEVKAQAQIKSPANGELHLYWMSSFVHSILSPSLAIPFIYPIHSFLQYVLSTSLCRYTLETVAPHIRGPEALMGQTHILPAAL